jgi:RNA recognition motif-containing protein
MKTKLYVGNLSYSTQEERLAEHFRQCGEVKSARIITDRVTGQSRGFGFVEMATPDQAQQAIEQLNGRELDRRSLVVSEVRDSDREGGRRKR